MGFGYFDWAIQKFRDNDISTALETLKSKDDLVRSFNKVISREGCYINDRRFLTALEKRVNEKGRRPLSDHTLFLMNRCLAALSDLCNSLSNELAEAYYEKVFDTAYDACWLLVSLERAPNKKGEIELYPKPYTITPRLRQYLKAIYEDGEYEKQQGEYIQEVLDLRKMGFIRSLRYECAHEEAREIARSGRSTNDLESEQWKHYYEFDRNMLLFYGLTVTSKLANDIRRQYV